jgi:hypothetical protein
MTVDKSINSCFVEPANGFSALCPAYSGESTELFLDELTPEEFAP